MSWASSCIDSGPHGGGSGSLFSWYTSFCSSHISPQEVLYPMSLMAGTSALAYSPEVLCWQPQQIDHSISFCPNCVVCRNILWGLNRQWGSPAFHQGYSSRNKSASRWHSASLTDNPSLCASPLAARLVPFVTVL